MKLNLEFNDLEVCYKTPASLVSTPGACDNLGEWLAEKDEDLDQQRVLLDSVAFKDDYYFSLRVMAFDRGKIQDSLSIETGEQLSNEIYESAMASYERMPEKTRLFAQNDLQFIQVALKPRPEMNTEENPLEAKLIYIIPGTDEFIYMTFGTSLEAFERTEANARKIIASLTMRANLNPTWEPAVSTTDEILYWAQRGMYVLLLMLMANHVRKKKSTKADDKSDKSGDLPPDMGHRPDPIG
ncbi:hypothetical protein KDL45_16160 [bacterium]|nr:hypothetical protein [bacterium]